MVDYAVEQGIADPAKLGVGGWSYGGISTDFIIAQTNRFKAAISGAGAALFASMYGHDQYQRDYGAELGLPWESKAVWEKVSPFYRVNNITTPTLFMGGDMDWNVPILGGEQMYQALKRLGRPTELVVYPGEYHEFKTPSHIKDRLERYLTWYNHYVKGDSAPARPPEQETAPADKAETESIPFATSEGLWTETDSLRPLRGIPATLPPRRFWQLTSRSARHEICFAPRHRAFIFGISRCSSRASSKSSATNHD